MVHVWLTASAPPHLVASEKSAELPPLRETPVICRVAVPAFVNVTVCGVPVVPSVTAGNASEPGTRVTAGEGEFPDPERETCCGEPEALSVKTRRAWLEIPMVWGVKVTLTVQEL